MLKPAVQDPADILRPFLGLGVLELVGRASQGPAVDDAADPSGRIQAVAVARDLGRGREERRPFRLWDVAHRGQRGRRLNAGLMGPLLAQSVAEHVEIERAQRHQQ